MSSEVKSGPRLKTKEDVLREVAMPESRIIFETIAETSLELNRLSDKMIDDLMREYYPLMSKSTKVGTLAAHMYNKNIPIKAILSRSRKESIKATLGPAMGARWGPSEPTVQFPLCPSNRCWCWNCSIAFADVSGFRKGSILSMVWLGDLHRTAAATHAEKMLEVYIEACPLP